MMLYASLFVFVFNDIRTKHAKLPVKCYCSIYHIFVLEIITVICIVMCTYMALSKIRIFMDMRAAKPFDYGTLFNRS